MSVAAKASGQASTRIAISWSVHSPMPGRARRASSVGCSRPARLQRDASSGDLARQRLQRADALAHDAQPADARRRRRRRGSRRSGNSRSRPAKGVSIAVAEFGDQPLRQRTRRSHGDLLAQHDAHRGFEAVHRAGHAQARACRTRQRCRGRGRSAPGRHPDRRPRRRRCRIAPTAGISGGASVTCSSWRCGTKRHSSQPCNCWPWCGQASVRRIAAPSTASTPGRQRCARKPSTPSMS